MVVKVLSSYVPPPSGVSFPSCRASFHRLMPPGKVRCSWMKLREIAGALGCQVEGDGELEISGVAGMEDAGPDELTFLANPKYAPLVSKTKAAAMLVAKPIPGLSLSFLVSSNPYLDFA